MSKTWRIKLSEGDCKTCCYATWCQAYAYADLVTAAGLLVPGSTRNDVCCTYLLSTTCERINLTMELRNHISQLKQIEVIIKIIN